MTTIQPEQNTINFMDGTQTTPIMQFGPNNEIRIRGELVSSNKEVYDEMVRFLERDANHIRMLEQSIELLLKQRRELSEHLEGLSETVKDLLKPHTGWHGWP